MTRWTRASALVGAVVAAVAMLVTATTGTAVAQDRAGVTAVTVPVFHPATGTPDVGINATNLTIADGGRWVYGSYYVDIWWGFDYSPTTNNLRAWAELSGSNTNINVQSEPLNLGDRNGLLAPRSLNSQTGYLEVSTGAVQCHKPHGVYRSNLHYSIRWPNGALTSNQQTGQYEESASVICR